jgi:hypothetical protein
MNLKLFFFIVLLLPIMGGLSIGAVKSAIKIVPLTDVINPDSIEADANRLYIAEAASVYIVSLSDFKTLKTFGKPGEGPQEFRVNVWFKLKLSVQPNELLIQSMNRISYFTKDGVFKKVQKIASRSTWFLPFEKGFVGIDIVKDGNASSNCISLYDESFQKGITFFKEAGTFKRGSKFDPLDQKDPSFYTMSGKIFVNDRKGVIHVFNSSGKEEASITYDYGKLPVTQKVKDEVYKYLKTDPRTKMGFEMFKNDIEFPEYFPLVRDYRVSNQKIYVFPFNKKGGKSQVFIFDMKGKLLKTMPVEMDEKNLLDFSPFAVENDKVYQVIENFDDESWSLRITDIK